MTARGESCGGSQVWVASGDHRSTTPPPAPDPAAPAASLDGPHLEQVGSSAVPPPSCLGFSSPGLWTHSSLPHSLYCWPPRHPFPLPFRPPPTLICLTRRASLFVDWQQEQQLWTRSCPPPAGPNGTAARPARDSGFLAAAVVAMEDTCTWRAACWWLRDEMTRVPLRVVLLAGRPPPAHDARPFSPTTRNYHALGPLRRRSTHCTDCAFPPASERCGLNNELEKQKTNDCEGAAYCVLLGSCVPPTLARFVKHGAAHQHCVTRA
jgi:hypothetical protein